MGLTKVQCVIVPGQVEEAAKELGFRNYANQQQWALSAGQTREQAMKAAKQRYLIRPAPSSEDEMSLSSDDSDFSSMSDTSEEGDFSVYNDEECSDGEASAYSSLSSDDD